jgi:hypothetical protein
MHEDILLGVAECFGGVERGRSAAVFRDRAESTSHSTVSGIHLADTLQGRCPGRTILCEAFAIAGA